jgi:hypothetical protein
MSFNDRVKARIKGKEKAQDVLDLVGNREFSCEEEREAYFETIRKCLFADYVKSDKPELKEMGPRERHEFRQKEFPFGTYKYKKVQHVEDTNPEYIDYLLEGESEFMRDLRRYWKNRK